MLIIRGEQTALAAFQAATHTAFADVTLLASGGDVRLVVRDNLSRKRYIRMCAEYPGLSFHRECDVHCDLRFI